MSSSICNLFIIMLLLQWLKVLQKLIELSWFVCFESAFCNPKFLTEQYKCLNSSMYVVFECRHRPFQLSNRLENFDMESKMMPSWLISRFVNDCYAKCCMFSFIMCTNVQKGHKVHWWNFKLGSDDKHTPLRRNISCATGGANHPHYDHKTVSISQLRHWVSLWVSFWEEYLVFN